MGRVREVLTRDEIDQRLKATETWHVCQLANLLGVHRSTVTRWIDEGRLAAEKHSPKKCVIRSADVFAYLKTFEQ